MGPQSRNWLTAVVFAGTLAASGGFAVAASCIGNCGGPSGADGVVTLAPGGQQYQWVSTNGGVDGAGQLPGIGGTDGSRYTTSPFTAQANDQLQFYFNYITSDGTSTFPDYGWAQIVNTVTNATSTLFSARTVVAPGNTSPGFGLPPNQAILNPATTPIIPGGPAWSPLGGDSGQCYQGAANGCGYTGWISSLFTIAQAGSYVLVFGVSNFDDENFDSGLAFAGANIGGVPIDPNPIPVPAAFPLFATGVAAVAWAGRRRRKAAQAA